MKHNFQIWYFSKASHCEKDNYLNVFFDYLKICCQFRQRLYATNAIHTATYKKGNLNPTWHINTIWLTESILLRKITIKFRPTLLESRSLIDESLHKYRESWSQKAITLQLPISNLSRRRYYSGKSRQYGFLYSSFSRYQNTKVFRTLIKTPEKRKTCSTYAEIRKY